MKAEKNSTPIVAQNVLNRKSETTCPAVPLSETSTRHTFDDVKRAYEKAVADGLDTGDALTALATAIAYSVLNKLNDPQRTTAPTRDTVSNNGLSPAMVKAKRDIFFDTTLLDNTAAALEAASTYEYDKDGFAVRVVVDKAAEEAAAVLMGDTIGTGLDYVNEAAKAILEQTAAHAAPGGAWLDMEVTRVRLSKRVYIDPAAAPEYTEEATTPIQEVYRALRAYVQKNRAAQTDPRNGYTYADIPTTDGLDTIYYRSGRYADIGGYDCNGNYTADHTTMLTRSAILARLNLSTREAFIISKREQGFSMEAIAAALGVSDTTVKRSLWAVQDRAAALGIAPVGYNDERCKVNADHARPVEQIDPHTGERIAVYASVTAAADMTGMNKGSISAACSGKRQTAGGYIWKHI